MACPTFETTLPQLLTATPLPPYLGKRPQARTLLLTKQLRLPMFPLYNTVARGDLPLTMSRLSRLDPFLVDYGFWPFDPVNQNETYGQHRHVPAHTATLRRSASPSLHKLYWPLLQLWIDGTQPSLVPCTLPDFFPLLNPKSATKDLDSSVLTAWKSKMRHWRNRGILHRNQGNV